MRKAPSCIIFNTKWARPSPPGEHHDEEEEERPLRPFISFPEINDSPSLSSGEEPLLHLQMRMGLLLFHFQNKMGPLSPAGRTS